MAISACGRPMDPIFWSKTIRNRQASCLCLLYCGGNTSNMVTFCVITLSVGGAINHLRSHSNKLISARGGPFIPIFGPKTIRNRQASCLCLLYCGGNTSNMVVFCVSLHSVCGAAYTTPQLSVSLLLEVCLNPSLDQRLSGIGRRVGCVCDFAGEILLTWLYSVFYSIQCGELHTPPPS